MTMRLVRRPVRATVAAATVAAVALLAACSGGGSGSPTSTTGSSGGTGAGDVSGKLQILVSSADASDKAFQDVNTAFKEKYPNVEVDFSAVPNENYNASRSSRLTAGNVDIMVAQPREVPDYVTGAAATDDSTAADAGLFVDLSDQPFVKNFMPSVMDAVRYKGKDYQLPTGLSYYTGVFYNKKIFADQGLQVPTTWTEFQQVVSKLQGAGIAPLGIGGKDSWPAGLAMIAAVQGLYPSADDKEALSKGIWDGSVSLADGKQLEVLQRVKALYDAAQPNFAGVGYDAIPAGFANGDFAMTIDGTWNQTTIDAAVGGKFDYGYFPLPVSDDAADNALLGGKVELRLAVASNAPNKAAALAWLDFFSQPDVYAQFIKTTGFAAAQPNIPASDFLTSIAQYTSTFSPAWDTVWVANQDAGQAAVFPFDYPAIAPMGTSTPEQAAGDAESAWKAAGK